MSTTTPKLNSIVRRAPHANSNNNEATSFGYGIGYRGGHPMGHYPYSYPPPHRHVAAIEVAIFHPAVGEIPYTLMSVSIPLSEVLQTFLDDADLQHREDYALAYNGEILGQGETTHSLGIDPHAQWPAAVFEVVEFGSEKAKTQLKVINSIGAALKIDRGGFETQKQIHLTDVDSLTQVFSFLSLDDLISVTVTCVLWHNVSQRLSLLLQLKCGAPPDVEYPAYLSLITDFSARLDLGACRARTKERQQWAMIGASKEINAGWRSMRLCWDRPYMFVKAAGCTAMRTVQANCDADELQKMTLPLRGSQVNFMVPQQDEAAVGENGKEGTFLKQIEEAGLFFENKGVEDCMKKPASERKLNSLTYTRGIDSTTTASTLMTLEGKPAHKVIKVADLALRQMSIKLFRSYFSPFMHYIFPLIAHQQELNGLDFRTTQLWGVTQGCKDGEPPIGAVAWRKREPLIPGYDEKKDPSSSPCSPDLHTKKTLEVLFIAVWESHRHTECGGALVAALEDEARASHCQYMYVEIGHEQPLARKFWGELGFVSARQAQIGTEQMLFFENSCLRFADTEQFVKVLS